MELRIATQKMAHENESDNSTDWRVPWRYQVALVTMYTVVFVGGVVSVALMISVLKSNVRSVTTVAVLNLVAVHLLFLLTVPLRIYFYASNSWRLSRGLCKAASAMIHAHMYVAFVFYAVVLVIRHLGFLRGRDRLAFHRKLHAVLASAGVWAVALLVVLPVSAVKYGEGGAGEGGAGGDDTCFDFGGELEKGAVAALNHAIIAAVLLVTLLLLACQLWIFGLVLRKYKSGFSQHQEFWAQVKSLCFVLVMLVCFVPYHLFRIRYVSDQTGLQNANEVFLAVTAFSCLDMLTFVGRNARDSCCAGCRFG